MSADDPHVPHATGRSRLCDRGSAVSAVRHCTRSHCIRPRLYAHSARIIPTAVIHHCSEKLLSTWCAATAPSRHRVRYAASALPRRTVALTADPLPPALGSRSLPDRRIDQCFHPVSLHGLHVSPFHRRRHHRSRANCNLTAHRVATVSHDDRLSRSLRARTLDPIAITH